MYSAIHQYPLFNTCFLLFMLCLCSNSFAFLNTLRKIITKEKPEPDYALALIKHVDEKETIRYRLPQDTTLNKGQLEYIANQGEEVVFTCPVDKKNHIVKKISKYYRGLEYCLVEYKFLSFEVKKCLQPMKPLLLTMGSKETERLCGPKKMYFLLRFVYVNCYSRAHLNKILQEIRGNERYYNFDVLPNDLPITEIYRICYNDVEMKTAYTLHHIASPSLLQNEDLPIQQVPVTQEISTTMNINIFKKNLFSTLKKAFKSQKQTSEYYMIPQMLVPKEDMDFATWKKVTYHYINVAPLWRPLAPLMNLINERIRIIAFQQSLKLSVYTAALNIHLKDSPEKLFLNNNTSLPIPNVWCKVVYDTNENSGIAIFIHNTPKHLPQSKICEKNVDCRFHVWMKESQLPKDELIEGDLVSEYTQYGYCCEVTADVMNYFGITLEIKALLKINGDHLEEILLKA